MEELVERDHSNGPWNLDERTEAVELSLVLLSVVSGLGSRWERWFLAHAEAVDGELPLTGVRGL